VNRKEIAAFDEAPHEPDFQKIVANVLGSY